MSKSASTDSPKTSPDQPDDVRSRAACSVSMSQCRRDEICKLRRSGFEICTEMTQRYALGKIRTQLEAVSLASRDEAVHQRVRTEVKGRTRLRGDLTRKAVGPFDKEKVDQPPRSFATGSSTPDFVADPRELAHRELTSE